VLEAWKEDPAGLSRVVFGIALLFIVFAFYGAGLEADLWSLVLLTCGLAIRFILRLITGSSLASEAIPAAPLE